jgi:crossover junction endodeoxyribonuclease RuvC
MIILGIDPGTATTGYGLVNRLGKTDKFEVLDFGVISTDKGLPTPERLSILGRDLEKIIKKFRPTAVGVERLFFTTNQKTAMAVSEARGVILFVCQKYKLQILEFTPLQVKTLVCGYGKAEKKQVQFMVQKTLKLKELPKPDDAADALALALCAAYRWGKLPHI